MEEYKRQALTQTLREFQSNFDPSDFLEDLRDETVTLSEQGQIKAKESCAERTLLFLDIVQQKGNEAYDDIVNSLKECGYHDDVVQKLQHNEEAAKGATEEDIPSLVAAKADRFSQTQRLLSAADCMGLRESLKLIKHFKFDAKYKDIIRTKSGGNYGMACVKYLLEEEAITAADQTSFDDAIGQQNLEGIREVLSKFDERCSHPEISMSLKSTGTDRTIQHDRQISKILLERYGIQLVDSKQEQLILAVPSMQSLEALKADVDDESALREKLEDVLLKQEERAPPLKLSIPDDTYMSAEKALIEKELELFSCTDEEFRCYLSSVGLNGKYPQRLSMDLVRTIRNISHVSKVSSTDIPWMFVRLLTALDCRVVLREKMSQLDNIRDFICALLHCSDNFLRQHILERLSSCQQAVTLLLPSPIRGDDKLTFLLWGLRRIVKKWKELIDSPICDCSVVNVPSFTVLFLRVGQIKSFSKSNVINHMFGRAQGNANISPFISKREDFSQNASFSKGSVEAHWYVPSKVTNGEILANITLFLNLRGDGYYHRDSMRFAATVADLVFLFVEKTNEDTYSQYLQHVQSLTKKVVPIVLHTEHELPKLKDHDGDKVDYKIDGEDITLSGHLCKIIQTCSSKNPPIQDVCSWPKLTRKMRTIVLDENDIIHAAAKADVERVIRRGNKGQSTSVTEFKEHTFKLQKLWVDWVKEDKRRLTKIPERVNVSEQEANIRTNKSKIRQRQFDKGLSANMKIFKSTLQDVTIGDHVERLHYFMTYFQSEIDGMVSKENSPHIDKICQLEKALIAKKEERKRDKREMTVDDEIANLTDKLFRQSEIYNEKHMGFEHFLRELGQYYEANCPNQARSVQDEIQQIAAIGATLLMKGYPLEILDGESAYMPISWITGVLDILNRVLKKPKIFVMSVIGVQSSGKSTLLNCMFGVRFPVRAGRCTRGLFMQLLVVDENIAGSLGFEYVLIIDTEGLQSPDRTAKNDHKFDNALATLAMCIVDLTILNIAQETIGGDIIGLLQIAVHALIRMRKVQLVSHCRIIHQRVSDAQAARENKSSMNVIREALDKATKAAAKEENLSGISEFADIFPFFENENLYIPTLWGSAMSSPNHDYSEAILKLKNEIIFQDHKETGEKIQPQFTLDKFITRLGDVWDALRHEDFVFDFQNSFNILSYNKFRIACNKLISHMRTNMTKWELSNKSRVKKDHQTSYEKDLALKIKEEVTTVHDAIQEYVNSHEEEEEVARRQDRFKTDADEVARAIKNAVIKKFNNTITIEAEKASLPGFKKQAKQTLRQAARETAMNLLRTGSMADRVELFEKLWKEQTKKLKTQYEDISKSDQEINDSCELILTALLSDSKYSKTFRECVEERGSIFQQTARNESVRRGEKPEGQKKTNRLFSWFQGNADNKSKPKGYVDKIASSIVENVISKGACAFDDNFVKSELNSLNVKLADLDITRYEFVNTMIDACRRIADASIHMQNEYKRKFSLRELMSEEKQDLKNIFFSYFDHTVQAKLASTSVCKELLLSVASYIVDEMNILVIGNLEKNPYTVDRQCLIGTILYDLCKHKNIKGYLSFVLNQESFIERWLERKVIETLGEIVAEGTVTKEVNKLTEKMAVLVSRTKDLLKPPQQGQHGVEIQDETDVVSMKEWNETFNRLCRDSNIRVTLEEQLYENIDCVSFTENLQKEISSGFERGLENNLIDSSNPDVTAKSLINRMDKNPSELLKEHLKGCKEMCPFCKVCCHCQGSGKDKHSANLHYPIALASFRYIDSQELVPDVCTSLVASDKKYILEPEEEYQYYRDYQQRFQDWNIQPDSDRKPSKHWQWVMAQFNTQIANELDAKPAEIPEMWHDISHEDALASLTKSYLLDQFGKIGSA